MLSVTWMLDGSPPFAWGLPACMGRGCILAYPAPHRRSAASKVQPSFYFSAQDYHLNLPTRPTPQVCQATSAHILAISLAGPSARRCLAFVVLLIPSSQIACSSATHPVAACLLRLHSSPLHTSTTVPVPNMASRPQNIGIKAIEIYFPSQVRPSSSPSVPSIISKDVCPFCTCWGTTKPYLAHARDYFWGATATRPGTSPC